MRARGATTAAALLFGLLSAAPAQAIACPGFDEPVNGQQALDEIADHLPRVAQRAGLTTPSLRQALQHDPSLWLDRCARAYYVEPEPTSAPLFEPALQTGDAFALHSRPGSLHTLYLDFTGHDISDSAWADEYGDFTAPPFSVDTSSEFSASERAVIADVWLRVAEDYAPFDVDVTTEDPGADAITRTSAADLSFGTRVAIVGNNPIYADCGCGGIAYLNAFARTSNHRYYQPAFVFAVKSSSSKFIAEAASHEAGHNFGLRHDGTPADAYYSGQGPWAPIMGVGYYKPVVQWSKGEYAGANNKEDDVATIAAGGAPLVADDYADTRAAATPLTGASTPAAIGSSTDVDWFSFQASGPTTLSVTPQAVSADLDVRLDLFDAAGNSLAFANPAVSDVDADTASGLGAAITATLPQGLYYARVDGVGYARAADTGYSDYASQGRYEVRVSATNPAPTLISPALGEATVGTAIAAQFTAIGGTPPYTFALRTGALPAGMTVTRTGLLTGTPASAGTYRFTVEVSDTFGATDSAEQTLTVAAQPTATPTESKTPTPEPTVPAETPTPELTRPAATPTAAMPTPELTIPAAPTPDALPVVHILTAPSLRKARVGKTYSLRLRAENAVRWQVRTGTWPKGLRMTAGGAIRGRPRTAGRYSLTVAAVGGAGQTATASLTIRVLRAKR